VPRIRIRGCVEISCLEVLDVLSRGKEASPVALKSFVDPQDRNIALKTQGGLIRLEQICVVYP
jgi:hypothetical protein